MRMLFRKQILAAAISAAGLAAASLAHANLVLLGTTDDVPGGVGNSAIVLSLQSPGNATTEAGAVAPPIVDPGPPVDGTCSGDTQPPCSDPSNALRTGNEGGAINGGELVILLDAQEPNNSLDLNNLTLNVWNPAGALDPLIPDFTASTGPLSNLPTCPGQGFNCVLGFGLDLPQASALDAAGFDPASWLIGLDGDLANVTGGPDRFLLSNRTDSGFPPSEIPEPTSLLLFAVALLGVAARTLKLRA